MSPDTRCGGAESAGQGVKEKQDGCFGCLGILPWIGWPAGNASPPALCKGAGQALMGGICRCVWCKHSHGGRCRAAKVMLLKADLGRRTVRARESELARGHRTGT